MYSTVLIHLAQVLHLAQVHPSYNSLVLDSENIFESLKNIKSNKAAGPDGISSTIISLVGPAIINGLENIFKRSFVTRTVSISWKRAKVTPILKRELELTLPTIDLYPCCAFQENYLNIRSAT